MLNLFVNTLIASDLLRLIYHYMFLNIKRIGATKRSPYSLKWIDLLPTPVEVVRV